MTVPDFVYEALANTGQRTQGTLTANSEREVLSMLDARGLYPIKIVLAKTAAGMGAIRIGSGIKTKHMTAFYSQLADLLHSGVPLLKSLDILEHQSAAPALGEVLREVRAAVADGTSLADAMSQHPQAFNDLAVSMVKAGQEGGFLEDVLKRIADFNDAQEDLKARVVGAMAYPVFLSIVGFSVLNILVIFFVPQFESLFTRLKEKGELPALTVALIGTSHFMQSNILLILGFAAILIVPSVLRSMLKGRQQPAWLRSLAVVQVQIALSLVVLMVGLFSAVTTGEFGEFEVTKVVLAFITVGGIVALYLTLTERGHYVVDSWKIRIPIAGQIFLSFALARFTRLMGTLLKNGIPILQSLRIAKDTTGNKVLVTALEQSAENITGGESLASPLRACKYFPRDVVEMIAVAEESNSLDKVLVDISDSLEKRTMRQLDLFVRLLEPLMLLVMAFCVLLVIAGLLLPIFKMSATVK